MIWVEAEIGQQVSKADLVNDISIRTIIHLKCKLGRGTSYNIPSPSCFVESSRVNRGHDCYTLIITVLHPNSYSESMSLWTNAMCHGYPLITRTSEKCPDL